MSGGGGTTTTTQNNTPFNSSQLLNVQNKAIDLGNNNPINYFGGTTLANPNQNQWNAVNAAEFTGQTAGNATAPLVAGAQSAAVNNNQNLAAGGAVGQAMPWINGLLNIGSQNPGAAGINALSPVAGGSYLNAAQPYLSGLANLANGTAANDLAGTANGNFLGANPYLNSQFGAAADPLIRAYQSATSPQTDSAFESAGRFNSGALANARSNTEANLGKSLGDLSANLYGNAYTNERGLMNNAATELGAVQNAALSNSLNAYSNQVNTLANAGSNLGTLGVSGANADTSALTSALGGYNNLITGQENAINATPALSGMTTSDLQAALNAGNTEQQLNQQMINDQIQRFYGNEMAPWGTLQQEAGLVGGAIPGVTSVSQPYYTNTAGQVLGGLGAGASIGSSLFNPATGLLAAAK